MRIHFSSAVTIAVVLLFVSGTVGCRSNGGAWYNPKSYTWTNPFAKTNEAPAYSSGSHANPKPSLDSEPNIDTPSGGYTDGTGSYASRTGSQNGMSQNSTLDQGKVPSSVAQGTMNPYSGGYSVAETSAYPPPYAGTPQQVTDSSATANQYQYPSPNVQSNHTPNPYSSAAPNTSSYGNEYPSGSQYQPTNVVNYPSATSNYASNDPYAGTPSPAPAVAANPSPAGNNYAPFGTAAQNDPYAAPVQQTPIQQPASAVPAGGYYDQGASQQPASTYPVGGYTGQPAPAPYANDPVPASAPYQQPYQPAQPSGGYGY